MQDNIRINNGYRMIYKPEYIGSYKDGNFAGWIYEHRYIMERELGRTLHTDEYIHHLDCDRSNNKLHNLIITDQASHIKIHMWIDNGLKIDENYQFNDGKLLKQNPSITKTCLNCGLTLQHKQKYYCSNECVDLSNYKRKVELPSVTDLLEDYNNMSMVKVGRKYGVSDNAVRKWFRNYGIDPRQLKKT